MEFALNLFLKHGLLQRFTLIWPMNNVWSLKGIMTKTTLIRLVVSVRNYPSIGFNGKATLQLPIINQTIIYFAIKLRAGKPPNGNLSEPGCESCDQRIMDLALNQTINECWNIRMLWRPVKQQQQQSTYLVHRLMYPDQTLLWLFCSKRTFESPETMRRLLFSRMQTPFWSITPLSSQSESTFTHPLPMAPPTVLRARSFIVQCWAFPTSSDAAL